MSIKDTIWLLAHSTDANDKREWAVLYFRAQGLTPPQIAEQLHMSPEWVQLYMGRIFKRFDIPVILDKYKKLKELDEKVFPLVREFIQGNPDTLKELPSPPVGEPEPTDEPDEPSPPPPEPPTDIKVVPVPPPLVISHSRRRSPVRACLFLVVLVVVAGAVGYLIGHWPWYPTPTPTKEPLPFPSSTVPAGSSPLTPATLQPSISPLPAFSDTPLPATPALPPKAFYQAGENVSLGDGVYINLQDKFVSSICNYEKADFGLQFDLRNSSGDQFLIRLDPTSFSVHDDLQNNYPIKDWIIGNGGADGCNPPEFQNIPFTSLTWFNLGVAGNFPPGATYLEVVIGQINGKRLVFRKSLQ